MASCSLPTLIARCTPAILSNGMLAQVVGEMLASGGSAAGLSQRMHFWHSQINWLICEWNRRTRCTVSSVGDTIVWCVGEGALAI